MLTRVSLSALLAGAWLSVALIPAAPVPALAQSETDTPEAEAPPQDAPGLDLSLGEPVEEDDGIGSEYVDEVFQDWERLCIRTAEGDDPCQMYQLMSDTNGNSVAEITIFPLAPGGQAAAAANVVTPLETLLTEQITLRIDGGAPKRYPFRFCSAIGCVAQVGFTAEELTQLKRGARGVWRIVPAAAPDQTVEAVMSLLGFTAAFDSLEP